MTEREAKVYALLNIYNDHTTLPLALDSVKYDVDYIIIADGAYQQYYETYKQFKPDAKPWSTDGSLEMLKAITELPPTKLIECPNGEPWLNQCVKRTTLLDAVPVGDWFIILDSDEMLFGDIDEGMKQIMGSGCVVGRVPLYNVGLDISGVIPFWHPRIFAKLPDMHYTRKHWNLCDFAHRVIEVTYPVAFSDAFVVAHLKIFRDSKRIAPHLSYMKHMSEQGWLEPNAGVFDKE